MPISNLPAARPTSAHAMDPRQTPQRGATAKAQEPATLSDWQVATLLGGTAIACLSAGLGMTYALSLLVN